MSIISYLWRGLTYSLTSIAALLVGHLMQNGLINGPDLPILAIPVIPSIFFFMCYAKRFPTELSEKEKNIELIAPDSIVPYAIIAGLITLVLFLIAIIYHYEFPAPLIFILIVQAVFYIYYGVFLWRSKEPDYPPTIRHQLVWSVILSIGISLYFGLTFSSRFTSWLSVVPVLLIGGLYFVTRKSEPNWFLIINVSAFTCGFLAFLVKIAEIPIPFIPAELVDHFVTIQFCVIVSAYLAVFESWWVTSFIARIEQKTEPGNKKSPVYSLVALTVLTASVWAAAFESWEQQKGSKDEKYSFYFLASLAALTTSVWAAVFESWGQDFQNKKSTQYSLATQGALTFSVWALPLFFVFSQYKGAFLIFFGLHALLAFSCWALWGHKDKLIAKDWGKYKAWAGYTFLAGLVGITLAQSYFPWLNANFPWLGDAKLSWLLTKQEESFINKTITWGAIFAFLVPFGFAMKEFIEKYKNEAGDLGKIFTERVNFTRILIGMCIGACMALQIIYDKNKGEPAFKADSAFIFYCVCIAICLIIELKEIFRYKPRFNATMSQFFAFLVLIRTVPSLLIALAVFLPSVYTGRSIWASALSALPFFLSAAGGYALNDYYDFEIDSITKPYRAIPSGKLSRSTVFIFSVFSILLALISALAFYRNTTELILYSICILGVALYNVVVKYVSLSKTLLTAVVSSMPLLFSVIAYQYPTVYLFLPVATCSFILGREWLMDVRDLKGDTAGRKLTIPMWLGTRRTVVLGFVFQFATVLLLLPIAIQFPSYWTISLIIMIGVSSALLAKLWTYNSGMFYQRVVQLLWLPMLFGVLLFAK